MYLHVKEYFLKTHTSYDHRAFDYHLTCYCGRVILLNWVIGRHSSGDQEFQSGVEVNTDQLFI